MKPHESITKHRVAAVVKESIFGTTNPGICIACGADHDGIEPDAHGYLCEDCDAEGVYGSDALLTIIPL